MHTTFQEIIDDVRAERVIAENRDLIEFWDNYDGS